MTGMKRLIGLPAVWQGKRIGTVVRGVLKEDGRELFGLVLREGLRASRFLPAEEILLLGKVSVICGGKPVRMPKSAGFKLYRVSDANGVRLGLVTDAVLDENTLRVAALEVSAGPVDDLIAGRWFATAFDVKAMGNTGHVIIPCRQN